MIGLWLCCVLTYSFSDCASGGPKRLNDSADLADCHDGFRPAAHRSGRRGWNIISSTVCYAWCTAVSFHEFGPTGRVKVQYSWNSIGSELLPLTTFPLF